MQGARPSASIARSTKRKGTPARSTIWPKATIASVTSILQDLRPADSRQPAAGGICQMCTRLRVQTSPSAGFGAKSPPADPQVDVAVAVAAAAVPDLEIALRRPPRDELADLVVAPL